MSRKVTVTAPKTQVPVAKTRIQRNSVKTQNPNPIILTDYAAELRKLESEAYRPFQLLNPKMLEDHGTNYKEYPKFIDPASGRECRARIIDVTWLETGRISVAGQEREVIRPVKIKPSNLMECVTKRAEEIKKNIEKRALSKPKREAMVKQVDKLIEDWDWTWQWQFATGGNGQTGPSLPFGDSVQYPPGPFTRQMYLQAMWDMQARCFEIKNHDGVAKGLVSLITSFVIGEGVKIDAQDDAAQEIWDEFAERCLFELRLPTHCDMLTTDGELFWRCMPVALDGKPGYSTLKTIDAGTVWEIITVPKDISKVLTYWTQYPTQYQLYTVDDVPLADYIVELVAPEEVIHLKINVHENEKRGRSDLQATLGDLKLLQDIMRYRAVRVINEAALVFDQKVIGQDTDVSTIANVQTSFLGAGTTHTHNESVELDIKQATAAAHQKSGFQEEMLSKIGMGAGNQPADYVGGGSGTNRASALTKVEPAYKFYRRRQRLFEFGIQELFAKVIRNAKAGGRIGKEVSEECEVIFPEIAPEDRKEKLANITLMESQEYWDHEKAATTAAKEMDDTTYDYEDTQAKIKKERLDDPQLNFLFQPTAPGVVGGVANKGPAAAGAGAPKQPGQPAAAAGAQAPKKPSTYHGDKAGMSSASVRDVKSALKMKQVEAKGGGHRGGGGGGHKGPLHAKGKVAHGAIQNGLRSRTKHTLHMAEETNAGTAVPAQMRIATDEEIMKCAKQMKDHPYNEVDFGETAPPGWELTVKKMKKNSQIENPFALSWWMDSQGYSPK